jgi:hypothetical protein
MMLGLCVRVGRCVCVNICASYIVKQIKRCNTLKGVISMNNTQDDYKKVVKVNEATCLFVLPQDLSVLVLLRGWGRPTFCCYLIGGKHKKNHGM